MPNPVRSEADAFRILVYMVAAIAVIVGVVLAIRTLA
jgi:predicted nucleic acid-binding Zn ribbon protein